MENKGVNTKIILTVIIGVVAIVILISLLLIGKSGENNPIKTAFEQVASIFKGGDNPEENAEGPSGSSGGGGGGSSGSGGSGGGISSEGLQPSCTREQISYSMENINKIEICNSYQESICIDKTVACSIQVKNMDQSSKGYFKIEKIFSSGVSDEETFDSEIQEFLLSPLESITLTANTSITSEGEGGLANKQINCFFYTRGNPYKEFC